MNRGDQQAQFKLRLTLAITVIGLGVWGWVTGMMVWWEIVSCLLLGNIVLLKKET